MIPHINKQLDSIRNENIIKSNYDLSGGKNVIDIQKLANFNLANMSQLPQSQNLLYTQRNNQLDGFNKLTKMDVIMKYDEELINQNQAKQNDEQKLEPSQSNQKYSEILYQINDKKTKHYEILQQQDKDLLPFCLTNSKQLLKTTQNDKTIQQNAQKQKSLANVTAKKIINKISYKKAKRLVEQNMVQIQRLVLQKIVLQNQKLKQSISDLIRITKKLKKNEQILKQARDINRNKISKLQQVISELNKNLQKKQQEILKLNKNIEGLLQAKQIKNDKNLKLDQNLLKAQMQNIKKKCQLQIQKIIDFTFQPIQIEKIEEFKQKLAAQQKSFGQNSLQPHLLSSANIEQIISNKQKYEEEFIKKYKCNHCNNFINQYFNMKQQVVFSKQKINNSQLQINRLENLQKEHLHMISNYMNKISKLQKFNHQKQEKVESLLKENSELSERNYTLDHGQYNIKLEKHINQLKQDNNILTKNYINLQDECQSLYKVRENLQEKIKIAQQIENQLEHYKLKQQKDQKQINQLQNELMRQKKIRNDNQNALREQYHLLYDEHKQLLEDFQRQCQKSLKLQAQQMNYQQLKSKYAKIQIKNQQLSSINQALNTQFKSALNRIFSLQEEVKKYQKQLKNYQFSNSKSQVDLRQFEFLQNQEFLQFDILNNQLINSSMLVPLYNKIEIIMHQNQSLKAELQEINSRMTELQQVNHELNQQLSNKDISLRQSQHKIKLLSDEIQAKQHQIQVVMSKRTIQSNLSDEYNEDESRRRVSLNDDFHLQNSRRRYTLKFQSSNQNSQKKKSQEQSKNSSEQKNTKQINDLSESSSEAVQMTNVQSQIKEKVQENVIQSQENLLQSSKKIIQHQHQQKKIKQRQSFSSNSQSSVKISKYEMITPKQSLDNQGTSEQMLQKQIYELTLKIQALQKQLLREQTDKQQVIQSTHRVWQQKEITQKQLQKQTQIIVKQKNDLQIFEKQTLQLSSQVNTYLNQYSKMKSNFIELTNKISFINNQSFKSLTSLKSIPIQHQQQNKQQIQNLYNLQLKLLKKQQNKDFYNYQVQSQWKQSFKTGPNQQLIQQVDPSELLLNLVSSLICNTILQISLQDLMIQQQKQQYHYSYVKFMQQSVKNSKQIKYELTSQNSTYQQNKQNQHYILKIYELQNELKATREELAYKVKKIQILQELETELTLDQKKLREYLQTQTKQKNNLQKQLQQLKLQLQNEENTYNSIAMQKCALQAEIHKISQENQMLTTENIAIINQIKILTQQNQTLKLQNEQLSFIAKEKVIVDVKEYKFFNNDMTETISSNINIKNQELQTTTINDNVIVKELQKQNLKQSKQISSLQVQNKNMQAENEKLSVQLLETKDKIKFLSDQINRIQGTTIEKNKKIAQNKQTSQNDNQSQLIKLTALSEQFNQNNQQSTVQVNNSTKLKNNQANQIYQSQRLQPNYKQAQQLNENKIQQQLYYLSHTQPNQFLPDKNIPGRSSSSLKFSQTQSNLSNEMQIKLMDVQRLQSQIIELREQLDRKNNLEQEVQRLSLRIQELQNQLSKQKNQKDLSPIQEQGDQNSKNWSSGYSHKIRQEGEQEIQLIQPQSYQKLETSLQTQHKILFSSLDKKKAQINEIQSQLSQFELILIQANKIFEMIVEYIENYQETTLNDIDQRQNQIQSSIKRSNLQVLKIFEHKNIQKDQPFAEIVNPTQNQLNLKLSPMQKMFNSIKYRLRILKKLQSQKYLSLQEKQSKIEQLNEKLEQDKNKLFLMEQKVNQSQAISERYQEILMQMLHLEQQKKSLQEANQKMRTKNTQLKTQVSQLIVQIQKLTKNNQAKNTSKNDINEKNQLVQQIQKLKQENHLQRKQLQKSEYELLKMKTLLQNHNNNIVDLSNQNSQTSKTKLKKQHYLQFLKELIQKIQITEGSVENIELTMLNLKQKIENTFSINMNFASQNIKNSPVVFDKQNSLNQILDNSLNNSPKQNDSPGKIIELQQLQQLQKKLTQNDALMKKYKYSLQTDLSNLMKQILEAEQHQTISRNKFESYLQKIQQKIHTQFNVESQDFTVNNQFNQNNKVVTKVKHSKEIKDTNNKEFQLEKQQKQNRNRFYTQNNRPSTMIGKKKYQEFDGSPSSLSSSQKLKFDALKIKERVFQKLSFQMLKHIKKLQTLLEQQSKKHFLHNSWLSYTPKYVFKIIESILLNLSKKQNLKALQNETFNSNYIYSFSADIQQKMIDFCLHLKQIDQQFESTVLQFSQLGKIIQSNMEKVSNKFISYSKKQDQPYLSINDIQSQQNVSIFQEDLNGIKRANTNEYASQNTNTQMINQVSSQKLTNFSSPLNECQSYVRAPFSIKQINNNQVSRSNTLTRRQSEHIFNQGEKRF